MPLIARFYDTDTADIVGEIEPNRYIKVYLLLKEQIKLEGRVMSYNDIIEALLSLKLILKKGEMTKESAVYTVNFAIKTGLLLLYTEKPMPTQTGFKKYYLVESQPF
jgi:hypothetical protein